MTVEELYTKLSAMMIEGRGAEAVNVNLTVHVETTPAKTRVDYTDINTHIPTTPQYSQVMVRRAALSAYTDSYGVDIHA